MKVAKGCQKYLRYLKFSYVEDDKEYFYGVSLGSAGYTVSTPDFYGDFEGGWESDKAGGKPGSANAQASLLNVALEGGETIKAGNSTIERFYPLKTGCEIVRLGLMAQGLASRHDFKSYSWGSSPFAAKTNPWKVSTEQIATHRAAWGRVREIVGLWRRGVTAEEFFKAAGTAVGLANEKAEPIHRVVSLLGPDGTWLRRRVESWLRQGVKDRTDFKIITVERDENWARDSNPRRDLPTLEVVIRELAQELGEALPPTGDPAQWLHDRLKNAREDSTSAESTRKLLVIDGADRGMSRRMLNFG